MSANRTVSERLLQELAKLSAGRPAVVEALAPLRESIRDHAATLDVWPAEELLGILKSAAEVGADAANRNVRRMEANQINAAMAANIEELRGIEGRTRRRALAVESIGLAGERAVFLLLGGLLGVLLAPPIGGPRHAD